MEKQRTPLGISKNGISVWYDTTTSHAATHIKDTPNLLRLAQEVISQTEIHEPYMQFHVDFGHTIGTSDLVDISPGDEIIYAKRLNRDNYTVFNKSKPAKPSPLVTVALEIQDDETCELVSAWIGPSDSPSFPGTDRETAESKKFWSEHALAWGSQEIQPGTETTICPW